MTYGAQFFDAGAGGLDQSYDTFARVVHIEELDADFEGTFQVPQHSVDRGTFYVIWRVEKLEVIGSDSIIDPAHPTGDDAGPSGGLPIAFGTDPFDLPTLTWDEATKTMTVAASTAPDDFHLGGHARYAVVFLHYK